MQLFWSRKRDPMKIIKDYVDRIDEELKDAKDYAEKYLYAKAINQYPDADYYKSMSVDELHHSEYLHEMVVREIKKLREVYQPTTEMQEVWDKSHARYVEGVAFIKKMLEM